MRDNKVMPTLPFRILKATMRPTLTHSDLRQCTTGRLAHIRNNSAMMVTLSGPPKGCTPPSLNPQHKYAMGRRRMLRVQTNSSCPLLHHNTGPQDVVFFTSIDSEADLMRPYLASFGYARVDGMKDTSEAAARAV